MKKIAVIALIVVISVVMLACVMCAVLSFVLISSEESWQYGPVARARELVAIGDSRDKAIELLAADAWYHAPCGTTDYGFATDLFFYGSRGYDSADIVIMDSDTENGELRVRQIGSFEPYLWQSIYADCIDEERFEHGSYERFNDTFWFLAPQTNPKHAPPIVGAQSIGGDGDRRPQPWFFDNRITPAPGSTHVVSDKRIGYLPFGEIYVGDGDFVTDRLFTGQRQDATGLYHYGAREYDPVTGRFIQPDPIVPSLYYPQDLNRYTYVRNNPLYYVDDSGQVPVVAVPAVLLLLKAVDYGWTAWDMAQATWTLTDPCASPADQFWAGLTIVLAAGFEIAEFDEWLQINLPLDDIARRQLLRELKQAAGEDGFAQVARLLREELGDEGAERVLRELEPLLGRKSGRVLRQLDLRPNQIGRLGEEAAGIRGPKEKIDSLTQTAFFRVPDEVAKQVKVLREVKNTASLSNTRQLRDYLLWAEQEGYSFELIVRENKGAVVGTRLSKALQALEQEGKIIVRRELPW